MNDYNKSATKKRIETVICLFFAIAVISTIVFIIDNFFAFLNKNYQEIILWVAIFSYFVPTAVGITFTYTSLQKKAKEMRLIK